MKENLFKDFGLVFCNGVPPSRRRLDSVLAAPKFVACADGGANIALDLGYVPDIVIGDLDSFRIPQFEIPRMRVVKIATQENTDLEKTIDFLTGEKENRFMITAFSGGRIDHTLANLQIAYECTDHCNIILVDEEYVIYPVRSDLNLELPEKTLVSIIPMEDDTIISSRGLKYELKHEYLRRGGRGISNSLSEDVLKLKVHRGGAFLFVRE